MSDFRILAPVTLAYHDIEIKGIEFLRNIRAASSLSIRPKTQATKIELERNGPSLGLNPKEVLTREALSRPYTIYIGPASCEEEQVKSLSLARTKDMMRKELLNAKENP